MSFSMIAETICQLARRLMQHPAAPYHEHAARDEVERICAEHGLPFDRDQFGNVLVRWRTAGRQRPLILAAHLDHPGFEIIRRISSTAWLARFRGGVADKYFRAGIPVRLMPGGASAKLGRRKGKARTFQLQAKSHAGRDAGAPRFAVWELEDFSMCRGKIYGRACDDLIGVAAVLATIIELKSKKTRVNVLGVISRAEE